MPLSSGPLVFDKKLSAVGDVSPFIKKRCLFSLAACPVLSFSLVSGSLIMLWLSVDFFSLSCILSLSAYSAAGLCLFPKLGIFSYYFFKYFLSSASFTFPSGTDYTNVTPFDGVPQFSEAH